MPVVPPIPTSAALANSNIPDDVLLQLFDAVTASLNPGYRSRWSSIAREDLLADLETACGLRGIDIGGAVTVKSVTTNLLR